MRRILTVELLAIVLVLVLIGIFTYIDSRQFMLEGFSGNQPLEGSKLLLFHADWCGYCKKMKPDWDRIKSEFPDRCEDIESNDITQEHRDTYIIKGFPTIYIINGNNKTEWNDDRTYEAFKKYLQEN